jgi:HPt (histidine-containing phosphotransfer) domain-containing protein
MDDYITKPIRLDELSRALTGGSRRPRPHRSAPGVDPLVIERLVASLGEHGREHVAELIDTFLGHLPDQLATLRAAVTRREADEVRRGAHTMKSNAASFGALVLADLCRDLETAAKGGTLDGAADQLSLIEDELKKVASELERRGEDLRR